MEQTGGETVMNSKMKSRRPLREKHYWEEWTGRIYTSICVVFLIVVMFSIVYFVASKGLSTFFQNGISLSDFLTGKTWNPAGEPAAYGALPFITGSFITTFLAALIASPLSLCAALFMTEIVPGKGKKYCSLRSSFCLVFLRLFTVLLVLVSLYLCCAACSAVQVSGLQPDALYCPS